MKHLWLSLLLLVTLLPSVEAQFGDDNNCSPGVFGNNSSAPNNSLIRSTLRLTTTNLGTAQRFNCTGSLINQLVDGKPRQYFVTARHCIHEGQFGGGQLRNLNNIEFVFNFQSNNGNNDAIPLERPFVMANRGDFDDPGFRYAFRSPVNLIYESSALIEGFGVDIALLEIVRPIPPHFNVFYAGYKSDALLGPGGVVNAPMRLVHQPGGDAKKFSVAPYVNKTNNRVATTCRTITKVIDAVIRLFGGKSVTELVCNYADVPQYQVPFFTTGSVRGGTSGAPFFTNAGRLFGVYSADLLDQECSNIGFLTAGKFRNAYANREVRGNLNPSYDINANLFGIDGRDVGCYPDTPLRLSGHYFPAQDYQPQNQVFISAVESIEAGQVGTSGYVDYDPATGQARQPATGINLEERRLIIYTGADFVFTAGQTIRLLPGFTVQPGASFNARIQNCPGTAARVGAPENKPSVDSTLARQRPYQEKVEWLKLTPNPAAKQVTCTYNVKNEGPVSITAYNASGQLVKTLLTMPEHPMGQRQVQTDVQSLDAGVYLIRLQTPSGSTTERLLIQR